MRPRLHSRLQEDREKCSIYGAGPERPSLPRITAGYNRAAHNLGQVLWDPKELMLAARSYITLYRGDNGSTAMRLLLGRDSKLIDGRNLKPPAPTSCFHRVSRHSAGGERKPANDEHLRPILRMCSVKYNIWFHLTWKSWISVAASSKCL